MLFNKNNDSRGITIDEFEDLCDNLGLFLTKQKLGEFFAAASGDSKHITFKDFATVMRNDNENC